MSKISKWLKLRSSKAKQLSSKLKSKLPNKQVTPSRIRLNQNLAGKARTKRDIRSRKKAEYLATLPKSRVKRFFYRLHPKRLARYWFSRDGLFMALRLGGLGLLLMSIGIATVFAVYRKDLPKNITDLEACTLGQTLKVYDRTQKVLLWNGATDVDCRPVALSDISPNLQKAVIAAEDKKFYSHHGFDPAGVLNAALSNVKSRGEGRGGSTITQQYVKLSQLSSERSVSRKIKELILAVELDASYKKNEILQAYLNEIGFAYQYNGAEAAARGLFDKPAKDLTLDEAATMAAGIPAPDFYWVQNQKALIERRDYVLDQMISTGAITKQQAAAAKKVDTLAKVVKTHNQYKDIKAPHFVLEVVNQLKAKYGKDVMKYGYTVVTTLDMNLQQIAEESISHGIDNMDKNMTVYNQATGAREAAFNNAAMVVEDVPTGQVVAQVGSRGFTTPGYGEINMATSARSPGSSFKPYDYASLMKSSENWGAGSIIYDIKTDFGGGYKPEDYDGREPGGITMRYALGGSRNIPAIKAMYTAGINPTHDLIKKMGVYHGITDCSAEAPNCEDILSTAIGDGGQVRLDEHVHGYATLSRLGKVKPQAYILKILDSKGKTLTEWKDSDGEQALDPQIAYIVDDMLSDRAASYFRNNNTYANSVTAGFEGMKLPAMMKTGTTNNYDNGWLMGATTKYATGVWIGNSENKSSCPDRLASGSYKSSQKRSGCQMGYENFTSPIWGEFMKRAVDASPDKPVAWVKPDGIKTVAQDSTFFSLIKSKCTAAQLGNVCGFSQSDIYPSWYTPKKAGSAQKATIDTISGKLATECTPELAKKEIISGNVQPEVPTTDPNYSKFLAPIVARYGGTAGGAIPTEKDDKHNCGDIKPTVTISAPATCPGSCDITATYTQGTFPVKTLNFKVEDQIVTSFDISGSGSKTYTFAPTADGSKEVIAEVVDEALYNATSPAAVAMSLPAPLTLTGTPSGLKYHLEWNTIANASCYQIIRTNPSSNATYSDCASPYDTENLILSGAYSFKVQALNASLVVIAESNVVTFNKP